MTYSEGTDTVQEYRVMYNGKTRDHDGLNGMNILGNSRMWRYERLLLLRFTYSLFLIGFAFIYYDILSLIKEGVRVIDIKCNHLLAPVALSDSTLIAGGRDWTSFVQYLSLRATHTAIRVDYVTTDMTVG